MKISGWVNRVWTLRDNCSHAPVETSSNVGPAVTVRLLESIAVIAEYTEKSSDKKPYVVMQI